MMEPPNQSLNLEPVPESSFEPADQLEEFQFEQSLLKSDQAEERRSMMSTGLIDPDDWNDNNYPDYYLLGS